MHEQADSNIGMIRIGITQRVVFIERIQERRDMLDQRWQNVAKILSFELIPIPNTLDSPENFADSLNLDGIIFSGGNNVGIKGEQLIEGKNIVDNDVAYERDNTEKALLKWCINREKPLLGVCRGMQFINVYLGGDLASVSKEVHVAKEHTIRLTKAAWQKYYETETTVNSYHNWGLTLDSMAQSLKAVALYNENEVEAFEHLNQKIYGIMWHPERYNQIQKGDVQLLRKIFN